MESIIFDEIGHTYTKERTGDLVPSTTKVISEVYGTGLENAPIEFVERASTKGTEIHAEGKGWQDGKIKPEEFKHIETTHFINWFKAQNFKYTKSEFIGYAKTPYGEVCGTIDLFADGYIYDLKTSKTATRKQLEKWQMQLSFYTYMLKQDGKSVLGLKILHLTDEGCEVIPLEYLGDDFVEATMKMFKEGTKATPAITTELQSVPKSDIEYFIYALDEIATFEKSIEPLREAIKKEMEQRNILDLRIGDISITYIPPTKRKSFDSARFKAEHADLYKVYQKESDVKSSIRIKVCSH